MTLIEITSSPLRRRHVDRELTQIGAGIVDQHVETAEGHDLCADRLFDARRERRSRTSGNARAPSGKSLRNGPRQIFGARRGERDIVALAREGQRRRGADAVGGAGHEASSVCR